MRLSDKAERIAEAGIDELRVLEFNANLAGLDAEGFIERVLLRALRTKQVVIGEGFRFGSGRGGDAELLRRAGATWASMCRPCALQGQRAHGSSTRVRTARPRPAR